MEIDVTHMVSHTPIRSASRGTAMKQSTRIPDLHYVVVPSRTVFTRAGHVTVFYRHDKDGKPFIYHAANHYGEDGRKTRANACRLGREVVTRQRNIGLRDTFIKSADYAAVRAAGLDPHYHG